MPHPEDPERGYTPTELGRLLRMSPDRIRDMIARGELKALNTAKARCGRPRFVVLPHHLEEWERRHQAAAPPSPLRPKRRRPVEIDFYPD